MMRSTLSTPPRAPRLRLTPAPEIVGAPHPFVGTMSTPDLLRRSELPSTEETPGRRDYDASGAYELTEDWWAKTYGEDEESSTSEEDSDSDDKDEDPDVGKNGAPQTRKAAGGGGSGKRGTSEDGPRDQRPSEMPPAKRREHERAKAEKKAEEDAAGAVELEAAAADFKRTLAEKAWTLAKKAKHVAIVDEVKGWAERGGTVLTAASWIRRLVSEGKDRLTPAVVRQNYTRTPPGAA